MGKQIMLQTDTEVEAALFDAAQTLAGQHGFHLVRTDGSYRLSAPGIRCRFGELADVAGYLRKAIKSPAAALAGADGATALDLPVSALQAVFRVMPIDTSHWTVNAENATRPRYTNDGELSNES